MTANPAGVAGESYAAQILAGLGFRILERNFSSRYGEIDIIAQKGEIIAFVEVKTRRRESMVSGPEAVTRQKQSKIIATAMYYMKVHKTELQPRFDVFSAVTLKGKIISHDHLEGAFDSGAYYIRRH